MGRGVDGSDIIGYICIASTSKRVPRFRVSFEIEEAEKKMLVSFIINRSLIDKGRLALDKLKKEKR